MASPTVIQWILDTRPLWPEATQTSDLSHVASRAMSLLSPQEQSSTLRYHFPKDAKLSLASALLKRLAISRLCGIPWILATATPDPRSKKPIFSPPPSDAQRGGQQQLVFNVSHQAGVVVLLAVHNPPPGMDVGVDIVCPSERRDRDRETIARQGWAHYVSIHEEVFSPQETQSLLSMRSRSVNEDTLLQYFYALWCLREAYVKMTGEALLAPWLADLEMRNFAPPPPPKTSSSSPGRATSSPEIYFQGRLVDDVDVQLRRALADEYMICTAVKRGTPGAEAVEVGEFELLDLEDVLAQAEALKDRSG